MAYQPKFARKNHRVSPFFVLLGVIVVPISLALTVEQLLNLFSRASGSDEADDKLLLS